MKRYFSIIRDWAKSNLRLLLTIAALVAILIRVEIGIAHSQRIAQAANATAWDADSEAFKARRIANDADSESSRARRIAEDARRVAEDAKSTADSAMIEVERVSRALRRLPY